MDHLERPKSKTQVPGEMWSDISFGLGSIEMGDGRLDERRYQETETLSGYQPSRAMFKQAMGKGREGANKEL